MSIGLHIFFKIFFRKQRDPERSAPGLFSLRMVRKEVMMIRSLSGALDFSDRLAVVCVQSAFMLGLFEPFRVDPVEFRSVRFITVAFTVAFDVSIFAV